MRTADVLDENNSLAAKRLALTVIYSLHGGSAKL